MAELVVGKCPHLCAKTAPLCKMMEAVGSNKAEKMNF